jgi:flagellar assembly protein FliH
MPKLLRGVQGVLEQRWLPDPAFPEPEPPQPPPDPVVVMEDVRRQAEIDAADILATAQAEADVIRRQAHELGMEEGQEEGRRAWDRRVTEMEALVAEINAEREDFYNRAEPELVKLSVAIAEKVVAQHLAVKPDAVVELVRTHVKRLRDREALSVRVNPDDLAAMTDARPTLMAEIDGVREIHLFDDRRVGQGGAVLESANGSLDARIPSQFDIINRAITDALEEPVSEQPGD